MDAKTTKLFLVFIILFFISGFEGVVRTLNNKTGHLSSSATISQDKRPGPETSNFLVQDADTVMLFAGFHSFTAVGTGANLNFTLTGSDSRASESVTLGGVTKTLTAITFSGTTNYLQNDSSPILVSNFGDHTVEAIINITSLSQFIRIFGHLSSAANDGMQLSISTAGLLTFGDTSGGSTRTNIALVSSISTSEEVHIVMTFSGTTRRLAYAVGNLVTSVAVSGVGNDEMLSESSEDDSYSGSPINWLIGAAYEDGHANDFNGKFFEFRISSVARYGA